MKLSKLFLLMLISLCAGTNFSFKTPATVAVSSNDSIPEQCVGPFAKIIEMRDKGELKDNQAALDDVAKYEKQIPATEANLAAGI